MILHNDHFFSLLGNKIKQVLNTTKEIVIYVAQNLHTTDFEGSMMLTDLSNIRQANQPTEKIQQKNKNTKLPKKQPKKKK